MKEGRDKEGGQEGEMGGRTGRKEEGTEERRAGRGEREGKGVVGGRGGRGRGKGTRREAKEWGGSS